jgi:hypothetical protein
MIFPLFRRSARPDTISTLYGMIVAQARLPCFYRDYAVADTVNGRFDLIVLQVLGSIAWRRTPPCRASDRAFSTGFARIWTTICGR